MSRTTARRHVYHRTPLFAAGCAVALGLQTTAAIAAPRSGLDPYAAVLARTALDQEPRLRVIYTDDAKIDGLTEFTRFLL